MIGLLHSWRNSLLLLAPHNFKLFALATFKSTLETYKVLVRVWYLWLIPVIVPVVLNTYLVSLGPTNFIKFFESSYSQILVMFFVSMRLWLTTIVCLAAKPATREKNLDYFKNYVRSFLMIFLVVTIFSQGYFLLIWLGLPRFSMEIMTEYNPLWIFFILFFLDSDGSIKQLWSAAVRAVKMTMYNLPLLLILMTFLSVAIVIAGRSLTYLVGSLLTTFMLKVLISMLLYTCLLKPLIINIWTNIYVKKLHETPKLYK